VTTPESDDPLEPSLEALVTQTLGTETALELSPLLPVLVRDLSDIDWRLN